MIVAAQFDIWHEADVEAVLASASRPYRKWVELRHVRQEWVEWYYTDGWEYVTTCRANEVTGRRDFLRAARNVAVLFCERRKAEQSGYQVEDVYYYSREQVARLVPLAVEDVTIPGVPESTRRAPSDPAEGGNVLALISDVRKAISGLPRSDVALVVAGYEATDQEWNALAAQMAVKAPSLRRRYNRILDRIVQTLGGSRPRIPIVEVRTDE